jgi:hypothetical protein
MLGFGLDASVKSKEKYVLFYSQLKKKNALLEKKVASAKFCHVFAVTCAPYALVALGSGHHTC